MGVWVWLCEIGWWIADLWYIFTSFIDSTRDAPQERFNKRRKRVT